MASSNEEIGREPFSWKRTWALAVAIGLHAFAFLLIVAPMAPPNQSHKEKEKIVQVSFIEPPPPPPPPPAPPPAPPAPPAPPPDIAAGSDLSYGTRPSPPYPPMAARQHHEGTVVLLILVGLDGSPKTVEVEKSSGYRELDREAKDWVIRHWKFNPEVKACKKVEGYARVPITFNLSG